MAKRMVITMGDPAGIGPEIIVKAFSKQPQAFANCVVAGDAATLQRARVMVSGARHVPQPLAVIDNLDDLDGVPPGCLAVFQIPGADVPVTLGQVSAQAGRIAGDCVLWATRAALRGDVAAVVTAPLHKEALAAAGLPYAAYPGHTELLQAESAAFLSRDVKCLPVRMMLANEELRTVLVSIHLSLRRAIEAVTLTQVLETLKVTDASLAKMLGHRPKIAVAGLNPHAGEGGLFGSEELEIIGPAIAQARAEGIDAHGPFPPDTVFMKVRAEHGKLGAFDVVVAMYHDQGLIPVKYLGVEQGVNVTLGLPLVRTSPDHGTAFDIAGTGRADPSSLLAAIEMARQLCA